MPEGPEVETEKLHEAIHEELEKEGGDFLRNVALTTALLAALAAIASLQAGSTVNEALALKTDATRLQATASDQWAYYQAKGIKAAVEQGTAAAWTAQGKNPPAELAQSVKKHLDEQEAIRRQAEALEHQRDEKAREAEELLHHHHLFAAAVALFQVSIALGAVAALTRMKLVWALSLLLGVGGAVAFALPFLH